MQQQRTARSAALLIDFDNVTLGVHSDLGRELKTLINSEVFRGKIAVRRAYADWRRYPNYVVPLTEASIDLIFAPAYGSSKKNTTDLRMSADAIELAFTRPEIDTFILLTGDSDFSSTVMKLKEYGKYVIGVGMRESSSDLIIQNCDEYFSYHALTGLTKTTAGEGMKEDPWELAIRAAQKMASTGDAMRTDRLKQVMLSIDPGFNEKELGYSKFSRFVSELEKKGLVRLHKLPDGQYEILVDGRTASAPAAPPAEEAQVPREGRGPRDGRRDRRGRRREGGEAESRPPQVAAQVPTTPEEVVPEPVPATAVPEPEQERAQPAAEVAERVVAEATAQDGPMRESLALLQRAVRDLAPKRGVSVRDGDVKRRMVELEAAFDEAKHGFSKFSRFLRAAHDAEAIDLQRLDSGSYEVTLGSRTYGRPDAPAAAAIAPPAAPPAEATAPVKEAPPAVTPPPSPPAAETTRALRGRRRGRTAATSEAGAPPILPGQVVPAPGDRERAEPAAREGVTSAAAEPAVEPRAAAVEPAAAEAAEATPPAGKKRRSRGRGRKAKAAEATPAAAEAVDAAPPAFSAEALGLPTDPAEIIAYVTRTYRGVGKKTVEPLLDAFGPGVFRVFAEEPHRVAEVIGDRRADVVLGQWVDDFARRAPASPPPGDAAPAPAAKDEVQREPAEETADAAEPEAPAPAEVEEPQSPARRTRRSSSRTRRSSKAVKAAEPAAGSAQAATAPPEEPKAAESQPEEAKPVAGSTRAPAKRGRGRKANAAKSEPQPQPDANAIEAKATGEDNGEAAKRARSRGGGKGRGGRRKSEASKQ